MCNPVIRIRKGEPSDTAAIEACVRAAYEPYLELMDRPPAPVLDDYAALVAKKVVYVATLERAVVGIIVMWPEEDHFYIDNIAVATDAQGTGIGTMLLQLAEQKARAANRSQLQLYTNEVMTENISFYPRHGFMETHRQIEAGYRRIYFTRKLTPSG